MSEERLTELDFTANKASINKGYSRFIKSMRLALPLLALVLTVVVMAWPEMDDKIVTVKKEDLLPNANLAENELINPRFNSRDRDLNPYTVTATRAIQNQQEPDLIKLDSPTGNMTLKDGALLDVKANAGSYEQKEEKLFLESDVELTHQSGYVLTTDELRVDLKNGQAFSDKDVQITASEGNIEATGLDGNLETEILIFKGPAKMTLNSTPQETAEEKTLGEQDNE